MAPSLVWFRQDLRITDQAALAAAAADGPVLACYVLDDETPGDWRIGAAQRWWLHHGLATLRQSLAERGVPLVLRRGRAAEQVVRLAREAGAARVHCLAHYEPWWRAGEAEIARHVQLVRHPGMLLAPPASVTGSSGGRLRIFTPYWRALEKRMPPPRPLPAPETLAGMADPPRGERLEDWQLLPTRPDWAAGFDIWTPGEAGAAKALDAFAGKVSAYDHDRNLPSIEGSARLSPHLHFGEISPATVWHALDRGTAARPFLREVGWRDFAANVIDLRPDYGDANGRPALDALPWRTGAEADADFAAWTHSRTGYPIVDAGMRQLWATGWMHNRVRMIVASFLTRHLLIDWRRGARWFWDTLVDADYANNSVNWQWVAGTGMDSNPFGRIMAPLLQSEKFDAAGYIRTWVPELAHFHDTVIHDPHGHGLATGRYPAPIIGHREGRARALAAGAAVKQG